MRVFCMIITLLLILSNIAYSQSIEYENSMFWSDKNDIFVNGDYAYCSSTFGILILDISNQAEPTFVSEFSIEGYTYGLAKFGDLLLACVNGLTIYDISDPYSPVYLGNFFSEFYYRQVFVYGNYAYSTRFSYDEIDYGLDIIDLSNPEEPALAGVYSTSVPVGYMTFSDSIAFYMTIDGFTILDISEPTSPEYINAVDLYGYNFVIAVENSLAYITYFDYFYWDGGLHQWGGIKIYNVSEPENPVFLGLVSVDEWIPIEIIVQFPYAYVSSAEGFKILDVSDPANPSVYSNYSGFGRNRLIDKQGNYCYIAAEDSISIQIVDVSDVNEPVLTGSYGFDYDGIYTCKMSGDKLYLGMTYGLQIADISNPSSPVIEDFIDMYYYSYNIYDSIAYVSGYVGGQDWVISFYDITDPSNPILLGSFNGGLYNYTQMINITVSDDILYGSSGGDIFFVDISDLSDPIFLGSYNRETSAYATYCVDDSILFCRAYLGNLHIVRLSDPGNPLLMSNIDTPGPCSDIEIDGNLAYIADRDSGLTVLDISDLYNPAVISQLETGGSFVSLVRVGNILIGINDENDYPDPTQVFIIDISDPYNPAMIASRDVYGLIGDILCKDNYIFICALFGLLIYEYDIETGLKEVATIPSSYSIIQNYPNPFNVQTTIQYSLSSKSDVTIEIYDLLGRKVETLIQGEQPAGYHQVVWNAEDASSGMYFYRIQAGEYAETKRMVLLK